MGKEKMTLKQLKGFIEYRRDSGTFLWCTNQGPMVVDKEADTISCGGYNTITLKGVLYLQHRLVWLFEHGVWPKGEIDHKDGNKTNNHISNLRIATRIQNIANRGKQRNNTSGYTGVCKVGEKYQASIRVSGVSIYLGMFNTPKEASSVYKSIAQEWFGEFYFTGGAPTVGRKPYMNNVYYRSFNQEMADKKFMDFLLKRGLTRECQYYDRFSYRFYNNNKSAGHVHRKFKTDAMTKTVPLLNDEGVENSLDYSLSDYTTALSINPETLAIMFDNHLKKNQPESDIVGVTYTRRGWCYVRFLDGGFYVRRYFGTQERAEAYGIHFAEEVFPKLICK